MDRRSFLKTLISFGVSINLPVDLSSVSDEEIKRVWKETAKVWGLFEVDDHDTLSDARFREPETRREAYGYGGPSELSGIDIYEQHPILAERLTEHYRTILQAQFGGQYDDVELRERAEEDWVDWYDNATGAEKAALEQIVETWLDEPPDWELEGEELYTTGTAQGAAYEYLRSTKRKVLEALGMS